MCADIQRHIMASVIVINKTVTVHWERISDRRQHRLRKGSKGKTGAEGSAICETREKNRAKTSEELMQYLNAAERRELDSAVGVAPMTTLLWLRRDVAEAQRIKLITEKQAQSMDKHIADLHTVFNGMLKTTSTPLPFPYAHMINFFLWVYLVTIVLPVAAVFDQGGPLWLVRIWSVGSCTLMSLMFFGLVNIGQQLEDPFGRDVNDFDLNAFAQVIRDDLAMYSAHRERCASIARSTPAPSSKPLTALSGSAPLLHLRGLGPGEAGVSELRKGSPLEIPLLRAEDGRRAAQ